MLINTNNLQVIKAQRYLPALIYINVLFSDVIIYRINNIKFNIDN